MRTFVAFEIPVEVRKKVDGFIQLQKTKTLPIKWVPYENLHITAKFLGEIDAHMLTQVHAVLQRVSRHHRRFQMGFSGIGCFPGPERPRVVWIGIQPGADQLSAIARELEEQMEPLGFRQEKRFHPHLTIGRIKKPCLIDEILEGRFSSEPFAVHGVTLFKSTLTPRGPLYDRLGAFDLAE